MINKFGNFNYRCTCPACFNENTFMVVGDIGKGFTEQRLVMCKKCSHISHNPYNSDIVAKYVDDTYSSSERESSRPTPSYISDSYQSSLDKLERIVHLLPKPYDGVVFDFGCGAGTLIKAFKHYGYLARGTEISTGFWEYANERGYQVAKTGNLKDPTVSSWVSQSNIISMIHVIEHLEHPAEALNTLFELSPIERTTLVIEYPDYWRAANRGEYFDPETYFHEYHLHDFNFVSMQILLALCGFRVLQIDVWDKFPKDKNVLIVAAKDRELKDYVNSNPNAHLPIESDVYERYVAMKSLCGGETSW